MTDREDFERELAKNQPKHNETSNDRIDNDLEVPAGRELDPDSVRPVAPLDEDGVEVDDEDIEAILSGE